MLISDNTERLDEIHILRIHPSPTKLLLNDLISTANALFAYRRCSRLRGVSDAIIAIHFSETKIYQGQGLSQGDLGETEKTEQRSRVPGLLQCCC